jgi:hypothetical protein
MKKLFLISSLVAACMLFSMAPSLAAVTELGAYVHIEHRAYSPYFSNNAEHAYASIFWEGEGIDPSSIKSFTVTHTASGTADIMYYDDSTGVWASTAQLPYYGSLGKTDDIEGFDAADWEGEYQFNIVTEDNTTYLFTQTIPESYFAGLINVPEFISFENNILKWKAVFGADEYRIRLMNTDDWSHCIYQEKLIGTKFDFSNLSYHGDYVVRIEALDYLDYRQVGRGTYFQEVTLTPVPGTVILIGSGLLFLTGIRRRFR